MQSDVWKRPDLKGVGFLFFFKFAYIKFRIPNLDNPYLLFYFLLKNVI